MLSVRVSGGEASHLGSVFKVHIMKYYWLNNFFSIFVCCDEHIFDGNHSHRSELNEVPRLPLLNSEKGLPPPNVFHHCELYGSNKQDVFYSESVYMCGLNSDAWTQDVRHHLGCPTLSKHLHEVDKYKTQLGGDFHPSVAAAGGFSRLSQIDMNASVQTAELSLLWLCFG